MLRIVPAVLLVIGALLADAGVVSAAAPPPGTLEVGIGPQLFLDDHFIARKKDLKRELQVPVRHGPPVLDARTFGTTQPYLTVLRDPDTSRYRIWYNRGSQVWHAESEDGIRWRDPRVAWAVPRGYGASLVDDGPLARDPSRRYKLANWQAVRGQKGKPGENAGMYVGFSLDGLTWTAHKDNPVLPTWPAGLRKPTREGVGDIVDVYSDPILRRYVALVKVHALKGEGWAKAPRAGAEAPRRLVGISFSRDFLRWSKPERIFVPDGKDEGLLEFYGMGGVHFRGGLRIGLVRVLRDDLPCDPGGPANGIGYTALAISRDGRTWHRFRKPFLDRNHTRGSWDHAMTWGSGVLPMGDELFLYYGGYARGHKVAAGTERQIGLARLKRDRYSALVPTRQEGVLRTRVFRLPGKRITINAQADRGDIRVRLLKPEGKPHPGLRAAEARPIRADGVSLPLEWEDDLGKLRGRPVCLEIHLRKAALFALEFHAE
jgi:hypothetical protein